MQSIAFFPKQPFVTLLAGSMLAGCTANPTVRYHVANNPDDVQAVRGQMIDSFYLQKNRLTIEYKNKAAADKPARYELTVDDTRVEDQTRRFLLLRGDRLWTKTTVNLSKVENTDLISKAGVEVADRRAELIQNVSGIAKQLASLGTLAVAEESCTQEIKVTPCVWELTPEEAASREGGGKDLVTGPPEEGKRPSQLRVDWGAVPFTAEAVDAVITRLGTTRHNGLYYAACRDVAITYYPAAPKPQVRDPAAQQNQLRDRLVWRGKIADPRWLDYVAFPRKGSIETHSQCGVSVKTESDPTTSPDSLLNTAVTQAVAIREAIKKADEEDD